MEAIIIKNKYFLFTIISILTVVLAFFNTTVFHSISIGVLVFIFYFTINGILAGFVLGKLARIEKFLQSLFGFLFLIYFVAFLGAIFIVLLKFDVNLIPSILIFISIVIPIIIYFLQKQVPFNTVERPINENSYNTNFRANKYLLIILPFLFFLAYIFLFQGRTDKYILSPWETVPTSYLGVIFLIFFIIGVLVFRLYKYKLVLLIIVILSTLIHSYLPIVYEAGYGGDKWRHLGTEKQIIEGRTISPSFLDKPIAMSKIGSLNVPSVLIAGNKTSYANQWSATVILSYILQIDIFWIDLLLVFLLWSIFMPLIFFQIGLFAIPGNKLFALLMALVTNIFYSLQVIGAITIPVSFGNLFLVFSLVFLIYLFKKKSKPLLFLVGLLSIMMYFNYFNALLMWLFVIFLYFSSRILVSLKFYKYSIIRYIFILLFIFLITFLVVHLDLFYSKVFNLGTEIDEATLSFRNIKSAVGSWLSSLLGLSFFKMSDGQIAGSYFIGISLPKFIQFYPFNSKFILILTNYLILFFSFIGFYTLRK